MSEWKEYKLGDLIEEGKAHLQTGPFGTMLNASEYSQDGVPVIAVQDIGDNKLVYHKFVYVNQEVAERLKRYRVLENDIIFGRKGAVERRALIKKSEAGWLQGSDCIRLRFDSSIDSSFISYQLGSNYHREWLHQHATGATMPSLNQSILELLPMKLPPLKLQAEISDLLSSLDNKINLLHRQNTTLEQLAETLFRQWFVQDIDSKELMFLDEFAETINGVSYKSSELNSSKVAMVSLKSFDRHGGFRIDGFKEFTGKFKERQTVREGDLIVAHTDITQEAEVIGNPALVISHPSYETLVISMDMVKVVPKTDLVSIEYLYYLMKTREFKGHCEGNANGSTVLHLSKRAIPTFEFARPDKTKLIEFTNNARGITRKFFLNHKQIRTLTQLRDTLLPKLMSGEVRVKGD